MTDTKVDNPRAALFKDRPFRWFLSGAALSMLGDQFSLIALPWLVLKMTGDPFAVGTVLALTAIPRAIFMLIGGALTDRYSPKRVLMWTKYINMALLLVLAGLLQTGKLTLPMVYVLAVAIGVATAFSIPAATAIFPHIVKREQLQVANSILMSLRQLTMLVGPILAGVLIAQMGNAQASSTGDAQGMALAFICDAASFLLSAWTLARVEVRWQAQPAGPNGHPNVFKLVGEGLRFCWNDVSLRTSFLYFAAIAFFIGGPMQVALPVIANQMDHGAAAFGWLMGAHGAGTLAGMILSGINPNVRLGSLGLTILITDCLVGALFMPMGLIEASWQGALLLLLIGMLGGFVQIAVFTWTQRRVPPALMGRAMSLFMFIFMGIAPISAAITGYAMRAMSLPQVFATSGALLIGVALLALVFSPMRTISDNRSLS